MRFGDLVVFCGPMFASKTNNLVKEILFRSHVAAGLGGQVSTFRIAFDTRSEGGLIESHDGLRVFAKTIMSCDGIGLDVGDAAFFDEVQFYAPPYFEGDFIEHVRALRREGTDVFCAGLDMDYMGRAFEITAALMAEATRVEKMSATCGVCNGPATHTARLQDQSLRFLPGDSETYASMCAQHWHEHLQSGFCEGTA